MELARWLDGGGWGGGGLVDLLGCFSKTLYCTLKLSGGHAAVMPLLATQPYATFGHVSQGPKVERAMVQV